MVARRTDENAGETLPRRYLRKMEPGGVKIFSDSGILETSLMVAKR
jgi:hypothetical protein